jgi:hypothetical protein
MRWAGGQADEKSDKGVSLACMLTAAPDITAYP